VCFHLLLVFFHQKLLKKNFFFNHNHGRSQIRRSHQRHHRAPDPGHPGREAERRRGAPPAADPRHHGLGPGREPRPHHQDARRRRPHGRPAVVARVAAPLRGHEHEIRLRGLPWARREQAAGAADATGLLRARV
jgi:hypothetical protein